MDSANEPTEADKIQELIHRRRRQVLVHSTIYYSVGQNLVSDGQYDEWARELGELQRKYPDLAESVEFQRDAFRNFEGTTGYQLPLDDPWAVALAHRLLAYARRKGNQGL